MESDYENELMDHIEQFSEKTSKAGGQNNTTAAISIKKVETIRKLNVTSKKQVLATAHTDAEKKVLQLHIKDFTANLHKSIES